MTVRIRKAVVGDENALAELNDFVQEFHVAHNPSYFKRADLSEVALWFLGLLEKPNVRIWIAEQDGTHAGYAAVFLHERPASPFCHKRRWIEIDQIGVRQEYRCSGIGRRLVDQTLRFAREENIEDVELTSWCFNGDAHKAFQKIGFTPRLIRFEQKVIIKDDDGNPK